MHYQSLINGKHPYVLLVGEIGCVKPHIHNEIEILYCIKGSFQIKINDKLFTVSEGYAAVIGSMFVHEFIDTSRGGRVMLIEMGPIFLKEYFQNLAALDFSNPIFSVNDFGCGLKKKTSEYFEEIEAGLKTVNTSTELNIIGDLYKIAALLDTAFKPKITSDTTTRRDFQLMLEIERALELVYYKYAEQITVDDAANATGYSKSRFCKIFKDIVGISFHKYLNNFRINTAKSLLAETNDAVGSIANDTGFRDTKTFCRAFRVDAGMPPSEYRKKAKMV